VQEGPGSIALPWPFDPRAAPRPPVTQGAPPPVVEVLIGYTEMPQACNAHLCAHHTFVVLREAGESFATRAGPRGGALGWMRPSAGSWSERFADRPSETVHLQRVGRLKRPFAELKAHVRTFNTAVEKAGVRYNFYANNSNTYTAEFLHSIGISASPDLWAPGFSGSFDASLPSLPGSGGWQLPLSP
jgi:hypothetical protein